MHTPHPYHQQLQKPMVFLSPAYPHPRAPSNPSSPRDPPGPPLAHPPLVLGLLVVVLVVAVVPPPGRCCNHSPGLARGVVGAVFCTGAGERGDGHFRAWPPFSLQEVWSQQPDASRGSCVHPPAMPPVPNPPGRVWERPTGKQQGRHQRAGVPHMFLPSAGGSGAQRARA